jgi:hypothetical protein
MSANTRRSAGQSCLSLVLGVKSCLIDDCRLLISSGKMITFLSSRQYCYWSVLFHAEFVGSDRSSVLMFGGLMIRICANS